MNWLRNKFDLISGRIWDGHPSVYVACLAWGMGLYFLHQLIISGVLLLALWILARHEGWRKGRRDTWALDALREGTQYQRRANTAAFEETLDNAERMEREARSQH